ncbi:MAG: hypothetical protein ABIH34_00320 [Nanoarchaeota archaeon]
MEKKEELFVGIRDPLELRRDFLESSKNTVLMLKRFHEHKHLHEEKLECHHKLKEVMKDIDKLTNRLRIHLPKAKLAEITEERKKIHAIIPHYKPVKHKPYVPPPRPHPKEDTVIHPTMPVHHETEIDRLEAELTDIEAKLRDLND